MTSDDKEVQVARITAKQAIIVALITALAGIAGASLTVFFRPEQNKPPLAVQHYIKMPTHFSGLSDEGYSVRIVADVNGQAYSYPSRAVWADVTTSMPSETFPLPIGNNNFDVTFLVFLRDPQGNVTTVTNPQKLAITATGRPNLEECELTLLDSGFVRAHRGTFTVHYEVQ